MSAGGRRLGQRSAAKAYISYGLAAVLAIARLQERSYTAF